MVSSRIELHRWEERGRTDGVGRFYLPGKSNKDEGWIEKEDGIFMDRKGDSIFLEGDRLEELMV